jgi:hypothetical protein
MGQINTAQCARLKTAIAEEVGNIQGMAERFIAESNEYLINRIPQGTFDASQGEEPRKVRYSTAPVPDSPYTEILVQGNEESTMPARDDCNDIMTDQSALIDKKGAFGCNLPGETISGGFDVFTRVLKGKAWETEPFCAMDLLLKKHPNEYIDMLQRDLPKRAMEQFGYSLERNVVDFGFYNTSVVGGFTYNQGSFPAAPEGVLDLGYVRRVFVLLEAQGWEGVREVGPISRTAFETMRNNYKVKEGVDLNSSLDSAETRFLDNGTEVVDWGGIRWILSSRPLRGWLSRQADGTQQFIPVRPTRARRGTGEGLVTEINEDYFNCFTICNGQRHELYEVGFYVSPQAATREAFAPSQVGGISFSQNLFNFEVNMIEGAYLECNRDNFKGLFRILHAYAFESTMPELMGGIIYRVSPDCVNIIAPCCDDECPVTPGEEVSIAVPRGPIADGCSDADCDPASCDDDVSYAIDPHPTQDEPCPDNDPGVFRFAQCGPVITNPETGEVCIFILRTGGSQGAAQVQYGTQNGTATAGVDFVGQSAPLDWADGENDPKEICIGIIDPGSGGGVSFNVVLSAPVGGVLADGTTNGCIVLPIDIAEPCVTP